MFDLRQVTFLFVYELLHVSMPRAPLKCEAVQMKPLIQASQRIEAQAVIADTNTMRRSGLNV